MISRSKLEKKPFLKRSKKCIEIPCRKNYQKILTKIKKNVHNTCVESNISRILDNLPFYIRCNNYGWYRKPSVDKKKNPSNVCLFSMIGCLVCLILWHFLKRLQYSYFYLHKKLKSQFCLPLGAKITWCLESVKNDKNLSKTEEYLRNKLSCLIRQ